MSNIPNDSSIPDGPLTPNGLRVCAQMCESCVFRPGNLMELRAGRLRGMIEGSISEDACIPCHKTLDGQRAVCRGFWERYRSMTLMCRLGHESVLGTIEVDPDASSRERA